MLLAAKLSHCPVTCLPCSFCLPLPPQVLHQVDEERLDKWRWQAFVGEEASLDILFQEAPDTPSNRCLTKVGAPDSLLYRGADVALGWLGAAPAC